LYVSASLQAGTLTVTIDADEENCLNNGSGLPQCAAQANHPNSSGCSLREALDNVLAAGNGTTQLYTECGTADPGPATPGTPTNTIVLGAHNINVNSAVPDPTVDQTMCGGASQPTCMTQYGGLPRPGGSNQGTLLITGGTLTCTNSQILHVDPSGDLTLQGTSFQNCSSADTGVAIYDQNDANLTMMGVTFTGIRSTSEGPGGCIHHETGNLSITGGTFSGCVTDNGGAIPGMGTGAGYGGAINIGNVGSTTQVLISGVAFTSNLASGKGGAIYLGGTDAIAITTSTFQTNFAYGTASASNPEFGGGAIFAQATATGGLSGGLGVNASDFLLFQDHFLGNHADSGNGGAILLYSGNLTYGNASLSLGSPGTSLAGQVPGGIVASSFEANVAGGAADAADSRPGSGGAIYAEAAQLEILDSSFVAGNASSNASGGAIAYMDATNNNPPLAVSNTTFNGNSAAVNGGAIANLLYPAAVVAGKVTLINDTLSGNTTTAAAGGGNFFNASTTPGEVNASNTIFNGGGNSANCAGQAFTSVLGNLQFNPNTGCGTMTAGDPMLKSASIFSGPNVLVWTMDFNAGSAASRAGDPATCAASPIDNLDGAVNGRPNPAGTNCDIGAYESGIVPDLTITKSHTDPFTQGDIGDTYTITPTNSGTDFTNGTVTVTDALPAGLTATNIAGAGWTCTLGTLTCTRTDALVNGTSYPITLTVNVAPNAGTPATNTATVAGGGEVNTSNDTATDLTNISIKTTPVTLQSFEVD
jgi:predicted outer membrane repeat protein